MAKKIPQFLEYFLQDCLDWNTQFTIKSMFWGYAIYKNWKIFSIFIGEIIYFKVWENNIKYFEEKKSKPFSYKKKNWVVWVMSYWELPEEILENREELDVWIERSLEVSIKTKAKKKSKKDRELDQKILEGLLEIPKWKVSTYKNFSDKFWVHSRRIASVMKMNNHPDIYPCFKIISHSWKISWYSWPEWSNSKFSMLEADWIKIIDWKIGSEFIV